VRAADGLADEVDGGKKKATRERDEGERSNGVEIEKPKHALRFPRIPSRL